MVEVVQRVYIACQLLMLYATWLFLQGSWTQTIINKDSAAPATGLPLALVYGIGIVFSVSVIPIILYDLYRVLAGKLAEDELVMITESEEAAELEELTREFGTPGDEPRPAGVAGGAGKEGGKKS